MGDVILKVEDLHVTFATDHGIVTAVQGIGFSFTKARHFVSSGSQEAENLLPALQLWDFSPSPVDALLEEKSSLPAVTSRIWMTRKCKKYVEIEYP